MRSGASQPKQPVSNKTDRPNYDVSDADLSDFRITIDISSSRDRQPASKNKEPARWIAPGETVKVANFDIKGGYFYYGGKLNAPNYMYGDFKDASLIDPELKVDTSSPDYKGDQMGYWPYYWSISPQSRAAYIEWLASNRDDPACYIGYVFLYFYGIERRLIIDGKHISSSERGALIDEILRLKRIYGGNHSFNRYAANLSAYAWALYNRKERPDGSLLSGTGEFTSEFKYLLGEAVADGVPVSSELALAWVRSHPEYSLRTPAMRCAREFDLLFKLRYKEKFGQGITIKPNKTRLQLDYYPASPTLNRYGSIGVKLDLPDPSRLRGPVTKLMKIATSCTDELDAYSRYIGKPANSKASLAAIAYLPDVLTDLVEHGKFNELKSWFRSKMAHSVGIIQTEEISLKVWENAPVKINKKEAETLANLVEKAGFGLAPDMRFTTLNQKSAGVWFYLKMGTVRTSTLVKSLIMSERFFAWGPLWQ